MQDEGEKMEEKIIYERDLNHTYLVCKEIKQESDYQWQMLLNNRIQGLLPCKVKKVDGIADLYYEITSKQPLNQLYQKQKMNYQSLKNMFQNLYMVIMKLEEFLLPADGIIMNPQMIYVDMEKDEFYFCVIPDYDHEMGSLHDLLEFLLDCIDYKDEKAVAMAYEWYKKAGEENSSFITIYKNTLEYNDKKIFSQNKKNDEIQVTEKGNVEMFENRNMIKTSTEYSPKAIHSEEANNSDKRDKDREITDSREKKDNINNVFQSNKLLLVIIIVGVIVLVGFVGWKMNQILIKKIFPVLSAIVIGGLYIYYRLIHDKNEIETDEFGFEDLLGMEMDEEFEMQEKFEIQEEYQQNEKEYMLSDENGNRIHQESVEKKWTESDNTYGETVFFSNVQIKETRKLEPVSKEFPEFAIEIFPFILGKLKGAVDGVIEHETVSRIHCKIELEEGEYYITDLNSTNGTVVNDQILNTNEKRPIRIGDEVRLGLAVYTFS